MDKINGPCPICGTDDHLAFNYKGGVLCSLTLNSPMAQIEHMTNNQRMAFFDELRANYCIHCGRSTPGDDMCFCNNDE